MRGFLLLFLFLSLFLLNPSLGFGELNAGECPEGSALLYVETGGFVERQNATLAGVMVRGEKLESERSTYYLGRRSDGWANLSSEQSRVPFGAHIVNCLPYGTYEVRVEYYRHARGIGEWYIGKHEHSITLTEKSLVSVVLGPNGEQLIYATPADIFLRLWPLCLLYVGTIASLFFFLLLIILKLPKHK